MCILTYGTIAGLAGTIAKRFAESGRSVSLVSVHTVKPLDESGIIAALKRHAHVIVIEESAPSGSLGLRVKQLAWDSDADCRVDTFSLQDAFIHCYGSHQDLLAAHRLGRECDLLAPRIVLRQIDGPHLNAQLAARHQRRSPGTL